MDAAARRSTFSNTANVTTPDTAGPAAAVEPRRNRHLGHPGRSHLDRRIGQRRGHQLRDLPGGSLLTTVGNVTSYSDTTAVNGTSYSYQVRAMDAAAASFHLLQHRQRDHARHAGPLAAVEPGRHRRSAAPGSISPGPRARTTSGVTNYEIFRGGSLLTTVGNVTSYSDTTVLGGVTYSYQVRAMDAVPDTARPSPTPRRSRPPICRRRRSRPTSRRRRWRTTASI